jgi:hypothetical protein
LKNRLELITGIESRHQKLTVSRQKHELKSDEIIANLDESTYKDAQFDTLELVDEGKQLQELKIEEGMIIKVRFDKNHI